MKIKNLSKEELESMGYDDIAYLILDEKGAKLTLPEIFKEICHLLDLSDDEYTNKIGDFFQILSTDHRFIMLEKGFWDLKNRHQTKVIIESDEEPETEESETEDDTDITEPDYDNDSYNNFDETEEEEETDDDTDDDLE